MGVTTENKYQVGDLVSERVHPYRKLKVVGYSHRVYQCQTISTPTKEILTCSEREIMRVS